MVDIGDLLPAKCWADAVSPTVSVMSNKATLKTPKTEENVSERAENNKEIIDAKKDINRHTGQTEEEENYAFDAMNKNTTLPPSKWSVEQQQTAMLVSKLQKEKAERDRKRREVLEAEVSFLCSLDCSIKDILIH